MIEDDFHDEAENESSEIDAFHYQPVNYKKEKQRDLQSRSRQTEISDKSYRGYEKEVTSRNEINEHSGSKRELEAEVRQLRRELQNHDQLYVKFKDLKLDYKQLLESFEKSESIRREQKELIAKRDLKIKKLQQALKNVEREVEELKQVGKSRRSSRSISKS